MPAKRGAKSSKTAHVLNLISNSTEPTGEATQAATAQEKTTESAPTPTQAPPSKPTVPAIEVAKVNNEAISQAIHGALDDAFSEDETFESITAEPAALEKPQEYAPLSSISAPWQADIAPPAEPLAFSSQPVAVEEAARVSSARSGLLSDSDVEFVNVMEVLVDEVLVRYIKMLGVCPCSRCAADVKALTLCRLPAKYVVLDSTNRSTVLSFYSSRFESEIKNQILVACQTVKEAPRHVL